MDQSPLQQGLSSRKEPEFIDNDLPLQSFLTPNYIRDPNNYIIDFMDSAQLVFQNNKNVGHLSNGNNGNSHNTAVASASSTTVGGGTSSYSVKATDTVSLTPDLHFPSSIFHYRPTQNDEVNNVVSVAEAAINALNTSIQTSAPLPLVMGAGGRNSASNGGNTFHHNKHLTHTTDYLTLNSDFLGGDGGTGGGGGDGGNKTYCDDNDVVNQAGEDAAVQQFLLGSANVSLNDAADLMDASDNMLYMRHISNARKVLPHKKRISRKLRVSLSCGDNVVLPPPLDEVHKLPEEQRLNVPIYSCEICGNTSDSQLQFFAHLKQHYEPSTPDTILAAMKTSLEELEPQKVGSTDKKSSDDNVDEVFNDVHLNFPDFGGVDEEPMPHAMDPSDEVNSELNANDINKCMSYVARNPSPPLKRTIEVEFSDSEDMLEGIRNVVDKVSIEDTCDALDLMTSNGMRGSWFNHDNFGHIAFKNKAYNDVSFTEPLPPMPMMASTSMTRRTHSRDTLPPAEKLLSYQKSDSIRVKLDLTLPPVINIDDDDDDEDEGVVEAVANRNSFYNDTLPPIRLPSVDADDDHQLRCQSPPDTTTPTELLEPLRVTQFELSQDPAVNMGIENGHLSGIRMRQDDELAGSVVVEEEVFCKEEPNSQEQDDFGTGGASNGGDVESNNVVCLIEETSDEDVDEDTADNNKDTAANDLCAITSKVTKTSDKSVKIKIYICTKCKRDFNSTNALKYHLRTHSGERPHQCDLCKKSFYALNALKAHKRTHTGDKPFKCEHCQRDFRQFGDLKYHVTSKHTDAKNYQCEFCGKAFSRKYSLVLHRRIHTSERNFKCEHCSKTFRASTYLQAHRKIHTGERPHECPICMKRFRLHGDLRRHLRIHQRTESKKPTKSVAKKIGLKNTD